MYTAHMPCNIDLTKFIRIAVLAALLTVGSLNVTRCTESEDPASAANDQYNRMHRIVINLVASH